jgi:predicted PurR-regulated permease PerM
MIYKLKGTLASAIFVVLLLLVLSLFVLTPMLSIIILGALFAYGVRPLSRIMEPYLKFRSFAIVLAMIIIIIPLIAVLALFISTIIQATPAIIVSLKSINLSSISSTSIQNYPVVNHYLPAGSPYLTSVLNSLDVAAADILKSVTEYLFKLLESVPMVALDLFIFFASTFYFARDGDKLWEYIVYAVPENLESYFKRLSEEIDRVLKSIFVGHFLTAIITGTIAGIGFGILGYPYPLFLGVLTGFFQLIPVIGHWPTIAALAIYDIFIGNYVRAVEVLALGSSLSIIDVYIRPKLAGKYADIHPLIFLLGFLCGPIVMGVVGFILGPLILGVTYAAVVAYKKGDNSSEEVESEDVEKVEVKPN